MSKYYGGRRFNNYVDENVKSPASEKQVATVKEVVDKKPEEKAVNTKPESHKARTTNLCNMRRDPSISDSNVLAVISANTEITIFDTPGEFYKVNALGKEGYILKELCVKI